MKSVTETERNLAMLLSSIHFPLPADRGFSTLLALFAFLFCREGLITTSISDINNWSLGSLEIKPNPSLTSDLRKLSLISPIDNDSMEPWEK